VEECLHRAISIATNNYRFRSEVDQEKIPGFGNTAGVPGTEPVAQQHALQIALEYLRIGIESPWQRMTGLQRSARRCQVGVAPLGACLRTTARVDAPVHCSRLPGYMVI